jgi:hypothetical protein
MVGAPMNLLHVTSLVMVMGMGVDYGVFIVDSARDRKELDGTLFSLFLSCLTSVFIFGALAISQHAALRAMGATTGLGILLSFALAPVTLLLLPRAERTPWRRHVLLSPSPRWCGRNAPRSLRASPTSPLPGPLLPTGIRRRLPLRKRGGSWRNRPRPRAARPARRPPRGDRVQRVRRACSRRCSGARGGPRRGSGRALAVPPGNVCATFTRRASVHPQPASASKCARPAATTPPRS